ncbi:MAG TPA: MFS transporter, partial [Isosphaeraceae bacterium]|nr:MFS transporter [Isosphaeraceae bacterium]
LGLLKIEGLPQAWIMNTFAIAALIGMFFGGQLADRYFAQERFLAFSHLVGGLAMLGLYFARGFWPIFGLMMLHCFFYVPTLSITNGIAFANLKDPQHDFGKVRLWGTFGWIAAAWPFLFIPVDWSKVPSVAEAGGVIGWIGAALSRESLLQDSALVSASAATFLVSGIVSLVLAAFCLTLPHTPPVAKKEDSFAPLEAIKVLAVPSILVLFIVTFLDAVVHQGYFFLTGPYLTKIGLGSNWIPVAMSVGQIAEIPAMAMLGLILKGLGWRNTLILGILGQAVRFGIYTLGAVQPGLLWLVILSNVVHGFAYACFFAAVYIFVDENFPKDVRTSAQSLFNFLVLGAGPFLGNFIWGWLGRVFSHPAAEN